MNCGTELESQTRRCALDSWFLGDALGAGSEKVQVQVQVQVRPPELQLGKGNQFWLITCFLSATCITGFLALFPAESRTYTSYPIYAHSSLPDSLAMSA